MELIELETLPIPEYHQRLKQVRLLGHNQACVYENAVISSEEVETRVLIPTQRYVLKDIMRRTSQLYNTLLLEGVDLMELETALRLRVRGDDNSVRTFHLTPPLVEVTIDSTFKQIYLLADGMHRVALARELNYPVRITLIRGASHPYYAKPLVSWNEVLLLDEIPEGFKKKDYREANYKALFRDYNAVFPGIQLARAR